MKQLLSFLSVFLFISFPSSAQSLYYHHEGERIMLTADSTKMIVKASQTTISGLASRFNISISDVKEYADNIFVIKQKNIAAARQASGILNVYEYAGPVFTSGRDTGIFLPALIMRLNKGGTIESILNSYPTILSNAKLLWEDTYLIDCDVKNPFDALSIANDLMEKSIVAWSVPDMISNRKPDLIPNDVLFNQQYYLRNTGQFGGPNPGLDLRIDAAWDFSTGTGTAIRVAVIDEGVEAHEEFTGRLLTGLTANSGTNGLPDPGNFSHGMHSAGIIGASLGNGVGIAGVAPNCRIIPINVFTAVRPTDAQVGTAIEWAWNTAGADVLSNSWSGGLPNQAITDAINRARTLGRSGKGCAVVFSSGNESGAVPYPSNLNGVITVGALNVNTANPVIFTYSNTGASMDLVAPSAALPGNVVTVDRMGAAGDAAGNYYTQFNGTSASCPQISGVIALMLSIDPTLTEATIHTKLQQNVQDLGAQGFDNIYGYGILNACRAVRSCLNSSLLTGPAVVCATANYSYRDASSSGVVTWSVTGPLVIVGSNTANPVTVSKTGNGIGTLKVTIAPWCDAVSALISFTKTITVGTPPPPINITGIAPFPNGQMDVNTNGTTYPIPYKWYVDNILQQTTNNISTTLNSGSCAGHTLRLDATNVCGTGTNTVSYTHQCSSFSLAPNPAEEEIVISSSNTLTAIDKSSIKQSERLITSVHILDMNGVIKKSWKFVNGTTMVKVNIASLTNGSYIIRISNNSFSENIKFIKQ
jgi:serine protease